MSIVQLIKPNPMAHNRKKLSQVCSQNAYERIHAIIKRKYTNVPKHAIMKPDSLYSNTSHREYLSRYLESATIFIINNSGGMAKKENTAGAKIKTKSGKEVYVKHRAAKKGMPDVSAVLNGKAVYFEIKAPGDTVKAHQADYMDRLTAAGAMCFVIRTVDDIFDAIDSINNP